MKLSVSTMKFEDFIFDSELISQSNITSDDSSIYEYNRLDGQSDGRINKSVTFTTATTTQVDSI